YFFILSISVTRETPRRRAASDWFPPVASSARATSPRSNASTCSFRDGPLRASIGGSSLSAAGNVGEDDDDDGEVSAARKSARLITPPVDSAARRAIAFSSWRTLPGHSV